MRSKFWQAALFTSAFWVAAGLSSLYAVGEKTIGMGGTTPWQVGRGDNVVELRGIRPQAVLSLDSAGRQTVQKTGLENRLDLYLSFDEGAPSDAAGNYNVRASADLQPAERRWARKGAGAALFSGSQTVSWRPSEGDPLTIYAKNPNALFYAGRNLADFSIEFFLYPANMEAGEEIFEWTATARRGQGTASEPNQLQSIRAVAAKNRLNWHFEHFWTSVQGGKSLNITLAAMTALTPARWSHHLIRFDSNTGLVEYLIDGKIESVAYATGTGGEGGEVWTPVIGERGHFSLGRQFKGIMDEVKISGGFEIEDRPNRYNARGGFVETKPIDLGQRGSSVKKIDVSGGVLKFGGKIIDNNHQKGGDFRFLGGAQLQFFVRTAETSLALSRAEWSPFKSGSEIYGLKGRFAQIRADFYPSGDLESTPYVENFNIEYMPKLPPKPPVNIRATAHDGSVDINWKELQGEGVAGYLVYYGTKSGEYFGDGAGRGASPLDAGKTTSLHLDSLKNGVLYYFAIAAYDDSGAEYPGEISREVSARPLRMLE